MRNIKKTRINNWKSYQTRPILLGIFFVTKIWFGYFYLYYVYRIHFHKSFPKNFLKGIKTICALLACAKTRTLKTNIGPFTPDLYYQMFCNWYKKADDLIRFTAVDAYVSDVVPGPIVTLIIQPGQSVLFSFPLCLICLIL